MRLTRSHVDLPLSAGTELVLPGDTANHLLRVLRLGEGDACVLFNGDGHDYPATITLAAKREARAAKREERRETRHSRQRPQRPAVKGGE